MEPREIRARLSRIHKDAFGWAMVCCGRDDDLATEVLQQAYCRILAGDAEFAGRSEFSTWVFGVIRHVALEENRRRARRRAGLQAMRQRAARSTGAADFTHDGVEQRELAERLRSALERVSPRQREVLHLTFYQAMTIEHAAEVLAISVGSARQHFERGKAALHRILAASGEFQR